MAVLVDLFAPEEQPVIMQRVLEDSSLVQTSLYFSFYVHRAMVKAGLGDRYLERMQLWQKMLDLGFTTFPEHPGLGARIRFLIFSPPWPDFNPERRDSRPSGLRRIWDR